LRDIPVNLKRTGNPVQGRERPAFSPPGTGIPREKGMDKTMLDLSLHEKKAGPPPSAFDSLIQNLTQEVELLRSLREALEREKEILLRSDVRELTDHNGKKETLVLKIRMLDEIRRNALRKLAREWGEREDAPLAVLASHADPSRREALLACREAAASLAASVRDRNEANREMIGLSLRHVQGAIDFLGEMMNPHKTYGQSGKWKPGKKKGNVVNTEG